MTVVDIYCRTAAENSNALAEQAATCRQFAEAAGLTIGMVHAETGSGLNLEREQLTRMRHRYLAGETQGVVVCKCDRLTRLAAHYAILKVEMDAHDITLHSVEADDTPKLLNALLPFLADGEAEKRNDPLAPSVSGSENE